MVNEDRPDEGAVLEEKKAVLRKILSCYMSEHVDEVVAKFFSEAEMAKVVHKMVMHSVMIKRNTNCIARRVQELKMKEGESYTSYNKKYYEKNKEKVLEYQKAWNLKKRQKIEQTLAEGEEYEKELANSKKKRTTKTKTIQELRIVEPVLNTT